MQLSDYSHYYDEDDHDCYTYNYNYGYSFNDVCSAYDDWMDECDIYLLLAEDEDEDCIPASIQPRRMRRADRRWTVRNNGTIAPRQNKHHRGTKICGKLRHFVTGVSPWRRNQIDRDVQRAALDQLNDYSKIRFFWE